MALNNGTMSEEILGNAFSATERGFMTIVQRSFSMTRAIASVGSCCLVGVIWRETLYIAHPGDSRAVIGTVGRCNGIIAEQLTNEHNASREDIRQELRDLHPQDPDIAVFSPEAWHVKGIIQVSRAIAHRRCIFEAATNLSRKFYYCPGLNVIQR